MPNSNGDVCARAYPKRRGECTIRRISEPANTGLGG